MYIDHRPIRPAEDDPIPRRGGPLPVLAFALFALLAVAGTILLALGGVAHRQVERALGPAEAGGGDLEPGGPQPGAGQVEAVTLLAEQRVGTDGFALGRDDFGHDC